MERRQSGLQPITWICLHASQIGRIQTIRQVGSDPTEVYLTLAWYYRPEEAVGGRKLFHGDKEVFLSDHEDEVHVRTVICEWKPATRLCWCPDTRGNLHCSITLFMQAKPMCMISGSMRLLGMLVLRTSSPVSSTRYACCCLVTVL
jgi:hypothetical protein